MSFYNVSKRLFFLCVIGVVVICLAGCVLYTEKRSQALSRAVAATADSIEFARFDMAHKYSKEAEKIAYPPKERVLVKPLITKEVKSVLIKNAKVEATIDRSPTNLAANVIAVDTEDNQSQSILRLVVPEHLKHAKLLIENSEEWNELLKTKEFLDQLKADNQNLRSLIEEVNVELANQQAMRDKMVQDLNSMQKKLGEKDAAIWKRNFIIMVLILALSSGIYLRMKGVL